MKMQEIREKARMADMKPGKLNKTDLIRAIQIKEGNPACFATGRIFCDQDECCWRADCLPASTSDQTGVGN
ncbi:MAG: SAP domain-containing protein [Deltaproteobacteria bacterium]|nr:SAP domain-containing protein [Deltaproteobacteria bacterium]